MFSPLGLLKSPLGRLWRFETRLIIFNEQNPLMLPSSSVAVWWRVGSSFSLVRVFSKKAWKEGRFSFGKGLITILLDAFFRISWDKFHRLFLWWCCDRRFPLIFLTYIFGISQPSKFHTSPATLDLSFVWGSIPFLRGNLWSVCSWDWYFMRRWKASSDTRDDRITVILQTWSFRCFWGWEELIDYDLLQYACLPKNNINQ